MLILAIDTSTPQVGVALGSEDRILGEVRLAAERLHAERLVPAISYVLDDAGVAAGELACVAVGVGPGLFTGLRVGISTAKVMAQVLSVPVVPVASLDLVAYPLRFTDRLIVSVVDARRGEVFYASYRAVPGGLQRDGDYAVGDPDDVAAVVTASGLDVLVAGDGVTRCREALLDAGRTEFAPVSAGYPSPGALVELAGSRYRREEFVRASDVEPLYLRRSDAEIVWDTRTGAR